MAAEHRDNRGPQPKQDEQRAANAARWAAVLVLIIGVVVVLVPAIAHVSAVFNDDPFKARQTTETVVTKGAAGETTTTTTKEATQSFVDRSLAAGGLLLLRLGVVALAAFLAGAVVQRALLGEFALKLGPLEIPELKEAAAASKDAVQTLTERIDRQEDRTAEAMLAAADAVEGAAGIDQRLERIENSVAPLLGLFDQQEEETPTDAPNHGAS